MNEEIKHHAKGLAKELKKAAEEFMNSAMPKDFSFEGEAKMKMKANGKTYEKEAKYSADLSSKVIHKDSSDETPANGDLSAEAQAQTEE